VLTARPSGRAGATLAELLVALTLAAVVLATATSTVLRQQRTAWELGNAAGRESQLRAATGALRAELSGLAVASGDLVAGEARDTVLQLRSFVAAGVACAAAIGSATFARGPDDPDDMPAGGLPRVGDTLWWYGESEPRWRGRPITASDSATVACAAISAAPRSLRRVVFGGGDSIGTGAPLRVTRPARYSLYRSGDGSWQLGLSEWIGSDNRFASPQPIAGPFLARAGGERSGFRYFDADGAELPGGVAGVDVDRVARLRVTMLARAQWAQSGRDSVQRDSVDVALQRERAP